LSRLSKFSSVSKFERSIQVEDDSGSSIPDPPAIDLDTVLARRLRKSLAVLKAFEDEGCDETGLR
jgi:hypothetical protein